MPWSITMLPDPMIVTISLGQFLDSIEENGLPRKTGAYWVGPSGITYTDSREKGSVFQVTSACAIGQSALNLEVAYGELAKTLNKQFRHRQGRTGLADAIISKNDGNRWAYKHIANFYRKIYAERLEETFQVHRSISVNKES